MKKQLTPEQKKLKRKLNRLFRNFDVRKLSPDPLEFPHKYSEPLDIELAAFVASVFAYGKIEQILKSLDSIERIWGKTPIEFLTETSYTELEKTEFPHHRFYSPKNVLQLFQTLKLIYEKYGSLKKLFLLYYFESERNLKNSLAFFSQNLLNIASLFGPVENGVGFMFPNPFKGSACKRMNLFLRWMVRKDDFDFGLWKEISTSQLVIPVDTHIARISKQLGFTSRKNVSWKMAEEITEHLKLFDPQDPVKYDFALCHTGVRKIKI